MEIITIGAAIRAITEEVAGEKMTSAHPKLRTRPIQDCYLWPQDACMSYRERLRTLFCPGRRRGDWEMTSLLSAVPWGQEAERCVRLYSWEPMAGCRHGTVLYQIRKCLIMRVVRHWNRLLSEMVDVPCQPVLERHLDNALINML